MVPETKPLSQLVDEFRKNHTHLAMVVDEFGTITGMVTLEDRAGADISAKSATSTTCAGRCRWRERR